MAIYGKLNPCNPILEDALDYDGLCLKLFMFHSCSHIFFHGKWTFVIQIPLVFVRTNPVGSTTHHPEPKHPAQKCSSLVVISYSSRKVYNWASELRCSAIESIEPKHIWGYHMGNIIMGYIYIQIYIETRKYMGA